MWASCMVPSIFSSWTSKQWTQVGRVLGTDQTPPPPMPTRRPRKSSPASWNAGPLPTDAPRAVLLASVNDPVAQRLSSMISDQLSEEVYQIAPTSGPDRRRPRPGDHQGIDRLLNAVAAFEQLNRRA